MVYSKKFKQFLLVLGNSSVDLFNYFKVDTLHSLSKKEAEKYPETEDDAYIMGMANYSPTPDKFPFVFINLNRLNGTYKDYTAIMHETVHISLLIHNWNLEKEEQIVSDAEKYANNVIDYIKTIKNETWFGKI